MIGFKNSKKTYSNRRNYIKVLFTGTYRQNDGWGRSSQDYLRALKLVEGIELEAKPIILSARIDPEGKLLWNDLEAANIGKPDICIYHTPPQFSDPSSSCYNIALFHLETSNIEKSSYLKNMDAFQEFWVATQLELNTLVAAGFPAEKCSVIPMPIDLESLDKADPEFLPEELKDEFVFLYVGDLTERKNIHAAVLAFWLAFTTEDKVSLAIKVTVPPNFSIKKTPGEHVIEWVEKLKNSYRLYDDSDDYPEVRAITDYIPNQQLINLQNRANCFVMPSRGESTCRPLLESYYLGKPIIMTQGIGAFDPKVMNDGVYLARSNLEPCRAQSAPMPGVYTSWETWRNVDVLELAKIMKNVIDLPQLSIPARKERIRNVYSYSAVARVIENKLRSVRL